MPRYYCVLEAHTLISLASPPFGLCDLYSHTRPMVGGTGRIFFIFDSIIFTSEGKHWNKDISRPMCFWSMTWVMGRLLTACRQGCESKMKMASVVFSGFNRYYRSVSVVFLLKPK